MVGKKNAEKALHWRDRLDRHAVSGLSIREFCAQEGISQPSFYAWRKRLRDRVDDDRDAGKSRRRMLAAGDVRDFIHLELRDLTSALDVIHPLGYQVRISGEVNSAALRQVLDVLDRRGDR